MTRGLFSGMDAWSVVGYSTAEGYSLIEIRERLLNQVKLKSK